MTKPGRTNPSALAAWAAAAALLSAGGPAAAQELCENYGPQTPRDIAELAGENPSVFPLAPDASEMNLCNIHTHTNAEHKAPGFSVFVDDSDFGGYRCNETDSLTEAELAPTRARARSATSPPATRSRCIGCTPPATSRPARGSVPA